MKNLMKMGLCLAALSPLTTIASPLAFPAPGVWHFTFGAETGGESYKVAAEVRNVDYRKFEGVTYTLGLNQSVGYGSWFYAQAKESGSLGFANSVIADDSAGPADRPAGSSFFDADIRFYFPLALSQTYKVSLQPQIGFAAHLFRFKARNESPGDLISDAFTMYRSRALAPLAGLALGVDVTSCFNFRFGMAFEFPKFRHRMQLNPLSTTPNWQTLRQHRIALHSTLDMNYKVGDKLDLTGSVDHLQYNLIGRVASVTDTDNSFMNRLSYKIGVHYNY